MYPPSSPSPKEKLVAGAYRKLRNLYWKHIEKKIKTVYPWVPNLKSQSEYSSPIEL